MLAAFNAGRVEKLIPIKTADGGLRVCVFCGTAPLMAADLQLARPVTGLEVQLCGGRPCAKSRGVRLRTSHWFLT